MNAADVSRYAGKVAVAARYTDAEEEILINATDLSDIPNELLTKIKLAYKEKRSRLDGRSPEDGGVTTTGDEIKDGRELY